MKKLKEFVSIVMIAAFAGLTFGSISSCKKGDDDPVISLKTRKDRFTNTWTLTRYEKDGAAQDISGSTYTLQAFNSGKITEIVQGAVFGFPTQTSRDGTWDFINDEEDVRFTFTTETITYNVQRLASDELWLKRIAGNTTHVYYFDGQ